MKNAENSSIFAPHFDSVFSSYGSIHSTVIDKIRKIILMAHLWNKIKKYTTKLANEKALRLNDILPDVFKAPNEIDFTSLILFYNHFWRGQYDCDKLHLCQVFTVPKKATSLTLTSGEAYS